MNSSATTQPSRSPWPPTASYLPALLFGIIAMFGIASAQCSPPLLPDEKAISYTFEPSTSNSGLLIHIILEFKGGCSGTGKLEVPADWAGQSNLGQQITNLKALSAETSISDGGTPSTKIVHFPPRDTVQISYDLVKDWRGPLEYPKQFRAVLEPKFFEFNAQNALAHPLFVATDHIAVRFEWKGLPVGWHLATSFGTDEACQSFTGSWHEINNALFAGGDFRIHRRAIKGGTFVLAVRGKWSFTDNDALDHIQKIVVAERDFWHDYAFPYYLVTLAPFSTGETDNENGSAFTNAFWLFLPSGASFSYSLEYMLAHESFHAWNPYKMGPVAQPDENVNWFTEGFTTYYAEVLLLRSGLLSFPQYIEQLDKRIREYEVAQFENESNKGITSRSTPIDQLPYIRGEIYALWLDGEIRKQSGNKVSLDDLMRRLVQDSKKRPRRPLTSERIFHRAEHYLRHHSIEIFRSFVVNGSGVPLPGAVLSPCVRLTEDQVQLFDLGFDRNELLNKNIISGVIPDSAAFKAGVRDGQRVVRVSIYWNDINKPVKLTVFFEDQQKQEIEYFPRGETVSIPQYHLADVLGAQNSTVCSLFASVAYAKRTH